ncbi:hypothetical protein [Phage Phass-1]|uniref:Uncharacterized protein n=1 Tax=Phage Phass-1 TaxID=3043662 RepID=A0AAF0LYR6_9CAUD|nr:hypothetical protein [Phage Phass-1]
MFLTSLSVFIVPHFRRLVKSFFEVFLKSLLQSLFPLDILIVPQIGEFVKPFFDFF